MASNLIGSLALFIMLFGLRLVALRTIEKWNLPNTKIRRVWIVQIRNATISFFVVGLFFIWASELKEFAVSIVAFAVALVIATKEIISCFAGGMLKYSGHLFSLGDRIEVGDVRGDVISHNLLVTTIYEVGPGKDMHQFTGRIVMLPNSIFLTSPVYNETETGKYSLHVFRVPFARTVEWREEARKLLDAANIECSGYLEEARSQFHRSAAKEGLEVPKVEPRIQIRYLEKDSIDIVVRMPVPARAKGRIEQNVLSRYADFTLQAPSYV